MTSEGLVVWLGEDGVRLEGEGRVALCPCPSPPVALAFRGARVTRGGDLFVDWPRLEVIGLPVAALPWLWLRAPERIGLLPPAIAWRGDAGLIAGSGVHLPLGEGKGGVPSLDLSGAGVLRGGFEAEARLRTTRSATRFGWDEVTRPLGGAPAGSRVWLEGRGEALESSPAEPSMSWRVDALRGARARSGTIELAAAAKAFDAGALEIASRAPADKSTVLATGVLASAARGAGDVAVGPHALAGGGGALGPNGAWDGTAFGGVLRDPRWGGSIALSRAALGAELDPALGPVELRLATLEGARLGSPARGEASGGDVSSYDAVASARAEARLPLVRRFGSGASPLEHWIAPVVEVRGALAAGSGPLFRELARPLATASLVSAAGLSTSLGRRAGAAFTLDLRGGALLERGGSELSLAYARVAHASRLFALGLEGAAVGLGEAGFGAFAVSPSGPEAPGAGFAVLGRTRLGVEAGLSLRLDAAVQGGSGAREARAIADGTAAAMPGDELAFLQRRALGGGAELAVPWTRELRAVARVDADLAAGELLRGRGSLGYSHPCGCVAIELFGARRLGRPGVDVWAAIALAPP